MRGMRDRFGVTRKVTELQGARYVHTELRQAQQTTTKAKVVVKAQPQLARPTPEHRLSHKAHSYKYGNEQRKGPGLVRRQSVGNVACL